MRALMATPDRFDVVYSINPWMGASPPVDRAKAQEQWRRLREQLERLGVQVEVLQAQEGLYDMVFTANAGMVHGHTAIVSKFRYKERRGEEPIFRQWFESHGYDTYELPNDCVWEGQACSTFIHGTLVCSYGDRADPRAYENIAEIWKLPKEHVRLVKLADPHFYHLDMPLCILDNDTALIYPAAFDKEDYEWLRNMVPNTIAVSRQDALNLACNSFVRDHTMVMNAGVSPDLLTELNALGYNVTQLDISEYIKAGGGIRCLIHVI